MERLPFPGVLSLQPRPLRSSMVSFLTSEPKRVPVNQARFVPASFH